MEDAARGKDPARGYIVHTIDRVRSGKTELGFIGRLEGGETFAVVETRLLPELYVRTGDTGEARAALSSEEDLEAAKEPSSFATMDGEPVVALRAATPYALRDLRDALHRRGIRTYEADVKLSARCLMDRRIRCAVEIRGEWRPGRRVGRVYKNPELSPCSFTPRLSILSLDLETDGRADTVYAASLVFRDPDGAESAEVLIKGPDNPEARGFKTEEDLLRELRRRILELDPDIITGWNVIDFDFRVLARRFKALEIPFDIGRSDSPARFLDREGTDEAGIRWKRSRAIVDGRQVLDGMWLLRISGLALEDYRLETAAQFLLGRGKRIERLPGESAVQAIERLYRTEPAALAAYCREDARLVLEILDKEGLIGLAVAKSLLIGTGLDQTWASVSSFETLYMEHMHAKGVVAPTLGIDQLPLDRAPGGGIITPRAGLYEAVLVFDFKSLYPSIMRTFNIDPMTHIRGAVAGRESAARGTPGGTAGGPEAASPNAGAPAAPSESAHPAAAASQPAAAGPITAPNGERFGREPGILPQILDRFFQSREEARREGNRAAVYAYKIVMNSFYGVLGTDGCRFAASALAGAVTTFGQHILFWTRDRVRAMGYEVIYGDTDSLFVLSGKGKNETPKALASMGAELCAAVNAELARYTREAYDVESRLELEFENLYVRFFLPPMRSPAAGADEGEEAGAAGRAKGYAGLRVEDGGEELEIKGMEAVRHDWTPLAQELQRDLLGWVFHDTPVKQIEDGVRSRIRDLRAGRLDEELVYRKILRKPVEAYTKASPPHARAASLLPPEERGGLIRYVWTREGPQPEGRCTAPPDYEHYVQKQVRPIVETLAPYIGLSTDNLFEAGGQLGLF
jgi:DNA polymerase-2